MILRLCTRCNEKKEESEEYFYIARPSGPHKKSGWQSYCKECWKEINAANKLRRKLACK